MGHIKGSVLLQCLVWYCLCILEWTNYALYVAFCWLQWPVSCLGHLPIRGERRDKTTWKCDFKKTSTAHRWSNCIREKKKSPSSLRICIASNRLWSIFSPGLHRHVDSNLSFSPFFKGLTKDCALTLLQLYIETRCKLHLIYYFLSTYIYTALLGRKKQMWTKTSLILRGTSKSDIHISTGAVWTSLKAWLHFQSLEYLRIFFRKENSTYCYVFLFSCFLFEKADFRCGKF